MKKARKGKCDMKKARKGKWAMVKSRAWLIYRVRKSLRLRKTGEASPTMSSKLVARRMSLELRVSKTAFMLMAVLLLPVSMPQPNQLPV
jgi:hypothetical protein